MLALYPLGMLCIKYNTNCGESSDLILKIYLFKFNENFFHPLWYQRRTYKGP